MITGLRSARKSVESSRTARLDNKQRKLPQNRDPLSSARRKKAGHDTAKAAAGEETEVAARYAQRVTGVAMEAAKPSAGKRSKFCEGIQDRLQRLRDKKKSMMNS